MSKNRNKRNKKQNSITNVPEKKMNDMSAYSELLRLNTLFPISLIFAGKYNDKLQIINN